MQIFQSELTSLKCTRLESASDGWYPSVNSDEPILITSQEDVGTKFQVVLTDNGKNWNPGDNALLSVWYSGSSGEGNYTQINGHSAFAISENTVEVEVITQMVACDGAGTLWLILSDGDGNRKTLCKLAYITLPGPNTDSVEAQQYYTAFSELIKAAETFSTDPTLTVSGKAADAAAVGANLEQLTNALDTVKTGLSNVFSGSQSGISEYPTKPGIYRCAGHQVFQNLTSCSAYGVLIILKAAYAAHFYLDMYGNFSWGYSGDSFGEPETWHQAASL